jgi:SAM-dependent methyltransferase
VVVRLGQAGDGMAMRCAPAKLDEVRAGERRLVDRRWRPGTAPDGVAAAYSTTGGSWQLGPGFVYDRLAEVVVSRSPVPLCGARVLDAGAGTGAASRAALAAGASRVIAIDAAIGMLSHDAARRPPAVVGDLVAVPLVADSCDVAVAAFSLNHLADPGAGLREMARVTRPGGVLLASAYAADDTHPVKAAVESALASVGWAPEPWHVALRSQVMPLLATPDGCREAMRNAGLVGAVEQVSVPFPELNADDLVAWRLGMAQHAPFAASLTAAARRRVVADATARLGNPVPPLVRSILVLTAVISAARP